MASTPARASHRTQENQPRIKVRALESTCLGRGCHLFGSFSSSPTARPLENVGCGSKNPHEFLCLGPGQHGFDSPCPLRKLHSSRPPFHSFSLHRRWGACGVGCRVGNAPYWHCLTEIEDLARLVVSSRRVEMKGWIDTHNCVTCSRTTCVAHSLRHAISQCSARSLATLRRATPRRSATFSHWHATRLLDVHDAASRHSAAPT